MKQIIIQNKTVLLDTKDSIGVGGEAEVYLKDGKAIKIYFDASKDRAAKLLNYPKGLPTTVIAPQDLVFDRLSSNIIGFTMNPLDNSYTKLAKYLTKSWRQSSNISLRDIALTFNNGLKTLKQLHQNKIVIGDLNKLGVFVKDNNQYFIDADSFGFDKFPCMAYTADYFDFFVDPNTLNYSPYSDFYAFLVLFLQSSLMLHPLGGTHASYATKQARFNAGITVFDKSVIYPNSVALRADFLSDDLLDLYHRWYAKKERSNLKDTVFLDYANSLVDCPTCKAVYPRQRKSCPNCATQIPVSTPITPNATTLIQCDGLIVDYQILNGTIQCLVKDNRNILYIQNDRARRPVGLSKPKFNQQFWLNGIIECDRNGQLSEFGLTTELYDNEPVYGTNEKFIYRLSGYGVMKGRYENNEYQEEMVRVALPNQTWFTVDKAHDTVYGFIRSGDLYSHWIIVGDLNYDIDLNNFKKGEVLLDITVKFTSKSMLLIHKTTYKGKEQFWISEITLKGDLIRPTIMVDWVDFLPDTIAYTTGSLFKATDRGVVRFNLETQAENTFAHTIDLVHFGDNLELYQSGILVIKNSSVIYIQ